MPQVILKYQEAFTDLNIIAISTLPLELRFCTYSKRKSFDEVEYVADIGSVSGKYFCDKELQPAWRQHTANKLLL